ncbi:MAG: HD domain-containing protein [Desulfurococcales archaeon]|nr:HD domain-containing protein [Desulfurococcales archaeon]
MVVVSPSLVHRHLSKSEILSRAYRVLENDEEVQELIKMANIMAVGRLRYNDHGIVHSRIVSGAALELFNMLLEADIRPTTLAFGTVKDLEEARLVVLLAAYLHDIGNAVHRVNHEMVGACLARDILDRIIPEIIPSVGSRKYLIRQEVMHAIYATEMHTKALTMEAGVVTIADGTDMAEGRARIPYRLGKLDMHAVSAISIKKVELLRGEEAPARIEVHMNDKAGLFQIEAVLKPKVLTSGLDKYIEIYVVSGSETLKVFP